MPRTNTLLAFWFLLATHLTNAQPQFSPRGDIESRYGSRLQKRITCEPARPDIFTDACNENPQNNFNHCFNTLVQYAQASASATCARFYTLYNSCLVSNNYAESACADDRAGYVYCANYTTQAYAYCGCYFALPDQLYDCANIELQIRGGADFDPAPTSTLLTSAILTGPIAPSSATLLDIPQSLPSANAPPGFSPRQSSTLLTTTSSVTSTIVTTSCESRGLSCAATTYSSTFASESSYVALVPPSSSLPATTGAATASYAMTTSTATSGPATFTNPSNTSSTSDAGLQQSTFTHVTTVPVPMTLTITSCPASTTSCSAGYSSESVFTTSAASGEAEKKWVVTMAAEVGRAGGTRALDVVVVIGGDDEEEEEELDVAVEVVDVVTVSWDVVVVSEGKVEELGGDAVTWGFTITVVVELWAPVPVVSRDVTLSRIGDELAAGSGWTAAVRSVDAGTGVGIAGALESSVGEKASWPVKVGRSGVKVGVTVQGEWGVEKRGDGSIGIRGMWLVEAFVGLTGNLVVVPVVMQEHLPLIVHHLAHSDSFLSDSNAFSVLVCPSR
ncbi:MAG: hypothetical protein Q9207_002541 [Kuettlingeria erythrocarpa]